MTYNSLAELFTATADAIRAKTGSTDEIVANDFPDEINEIVTLSEGTADATATASDIANGKTAWVQGEQVTGTATITGTDAFTYYSEEPDCTVSDVRIPNCFASPRAAGTIYVYGAAIVFLSSEDGHTCTAFLGDKVADGEFYNVVDMQINEFYDEIRFNGNLNDDVWKLGVAVVKELA